MQKVTVVENIDYAVIACGYESRLEPDVQKIIKRIDELHEVSLLSIYINQRVIYNSDIDRSVLEAIRARDNYNHGVVVKCGSLSNAFDVAEVLMKFDHCAMFSMGTLYSIEIWIYNDKQIAVLKFDTESG